MRFASSGSTISPLPITGTDTASFTALIYDQSACPLYICSLVRPCTAIAATPVDSMRLAKSTTLMESLSQPMRIFTVTGTSTALTAASATRAAKSGFFISAEPSPEVTTFFTGQPILISTISAPASATTFAPNAIASGLEPKICIDTGRSTSSIRNNS